MNNSLSFNQVLELAQNAEADEDSAFFLLVEPNGTFTLGAGRANNTVPNNSLPWMGASPFFSQQHDRKWPDWGKLRPTFFQPKHYFQHSKVPTNPSEREVPKFTLMPSLDDSSKAKNAWFLLMKAAIAKIAKGDFEKVVLSRAKEHKLNRPLTLANLVEVILQAKTQNSYKFITLIERKIFFGLTPEKLFTKKGLSVHSDSIAGTAARSNNPDQDAEIAKELLSSNKNLREHAIVVDSIREKLSKLGGTLSKKIAPELLSLEKLYHLYTPIQMQLKEAVHPLQILERIHPTPALAGFPESPAIDFLLKNEGYARGYYAAPVGFFTPDNSLFVAGIRSALLDKDHLITFAGAGVVAGSDTEEEWQETERKMQTILGLFDK